METFNYVLYILNTTIIAFVTVAFAFQFIYLLLFFLKKRTYPKAKEQHYCGIYICARNEEEVIGRTIKYLQKLNYPKDKYEIIVMADNCTDKTAQIARSLSNEVKVRVFERHEDDPKKRNVGYASQYLFEQLMPEIDNYDFFVRFDADDIVDKDYLNYMNDAFESGVKAAKGYNNASNLTQNLVAGVSGLWYIRDSRFNCHARAALHTDVFLVGGGMMFAASVIKEDGGWISTGTSEDTQFTIVNMKKNRKVAYVPDAILYEDQPSSLKTLFIRNIRMGKSLHRLFWSEGWKCLGKFFTTFRYKYLDMFLNLFFIPIAVVCCTWFPAYYIYLIVYNLVVQDMPAFYEILINIAWIMGFAFLLPFIVQAFLVVALDKKKIKVPMKKLVGTCFAFPMFMIIYALGIVFGVFSSKQKWGQVKRNNYENSVEFQTILKDNGYIE